MTRVSNRIALVCGVAVTVIATLAGAQQQVYRYIDKDGRIIYTDRAPPADGKEVQAKRLTPNFIENNDIPVATSQAAQRFPVTLYTFPCGQVCLSAEALLNRRGVPFTTVNVEDQKGADQLQKLTGAQQAPVLLVGDKLIAKGFNEARWTALLDDAGYPKTPARRVTAKSAAPAAAPAAPAPAAPAEATQAVAVPGGGYPKQ
ncbi:MAG: glutaredoxin family protein [Betaproteobacteria bacterium]